MQTIDEAKLETDLHYRYEFLANFIDFTADDAKVIQAFAPHLGPRIPQLVEQTYSKLLSFDATAKHFLPKQSGFEGETPVNLADLSLDHPQIQFRKDHLNRYLMALIGRSYNAKMVEYLDMVGKIHTTQAGNSEINVPLIQMNALMGQLSDILFIAISESPLSAEQKLETQRSFNKLLWIQNDLISRHYAHDEK